MTPKSPLHRKLSSASTAIRGLFGAGEEQDAAVARLEQLRTNIRMVRQSVRVCVRVRLVVMMVVVVEQQLRTNMRRA